jgi:hypothetical protein
MAKKSRYRTTPHPHVQRLQEQVAQLLQAAADRERVAREVAAEQTQALAEMREQLTRDTTERAQPTRHDVAQIAEAARHERLLENRVAGLAHVRAAYRSEQLAPVAQASPVRRMVFAAAAVVGIAAGLWAITTYWSWSPCSASSRSSPGTGSRWRVRIDAWGRIREGFVPPGPLPHPRKKQGSRRRATLLNSRGGSGVTPNEKAGLGGSLGGMPTFVLDPQPSEIDELLERRRAAGADRWDEVWDGVLHMIPPPSVNHQRLASQLHRLLGPLADQAGFVLTAEVGIGSGQHDYRTPDLALLRAGYAPQWNATAALVGEIVSPGDETWEKLGFYAAHRVDEVLIVDPGERQVHWLALGADGEYTHCEQSSLIKLGAAKLASIIDWPK